MYFENEMERREFLKAIDGLTIKGESVDLLYALKNTFVSAKIINKNVDGKNAVNDLENNK